MRQEDESDDSDDDDGFLARMTGIGAKHREKRDDKENAHSAYHITFCKAQFEAGQLAVEFNAATERWGRLPRVTFVTSSVYKFAARVGVQGALETTRVLGERRLGGDYKKFTNNAGKSADFPGSDMDCGPVVEPKTRAQPQQGLFGLGAIGEEDEEEESDDEPEHLTAGEVPQAFSHWSYESSSGARMVCDLQGCFDRERGFELTDPCMLSKVGREESGYGRTDRGLHGLVDFFRTHKCTPLCKALGLTDARAREQELVVEEALRKKEEREASRAAAERAAEKEKEKRKQEKADRKARRRAEKLQEKEVEDDIAAAAAEVQAEVERKQRQDRIDAAKGAGSAAVDAVGALPGLAKKVPGFVGTAAGFVGAGASEFAGKVSRGAAAAATRLKDATKQSVAATRARMMLSASAKELEDAAAEAGFPRTTAGVNRYKQSLRDKIKAEELAARRAEEKVVKERRAKAAKDAREAARREKVAQSVKEARAAEEQMNEEKKEESDEDSDDSNDDGLAFLALMQRGEGKRRREARRRERRALERSMHPVDEYGDEVKEVD